MAKGLAEVLAGFGDQRILLIGDSIVDIYTYGTAIGLSAETPTIVARKREVHRTLGGAGLVCRNLLELGAQVTFITKIGEDEDAAYVREFSAPRLEFLPVAEADRPTTVKHRFWVDGYKLFQLDNRDDREICPAGVEQVMMFVHERLAAMDAVIISDYRHGLLSRDLIGRLKAAIGDAGATLYVDSQVSQTASNHTLYRGGAVICLNLKEAQCIDPGFEPRNDAVAFASLREKLDTDRIIVKRGSEGAMMLVGDEVVNAPARRVEAVDTTGAGDAFLSAFSLCADAAPEVALRVANTWAGLAIGIHGTSPPCRADLPKALGLE